MLTVQAYEKRREQLAHKLAEGAVAIIPGKEEILRNGDSHYSFRQDSNFYYLTGFNEPEALLVLFANGESHLFNRPRDSALEQWTGPRLGQDEAPRRLKVTKAYALEQLDKELPSLLANTTIIYYDIGHHPTYEKRILQALQKVKDQRRRGINAPEAIYDLEPLLSEMRLFKSEDELKLLRKAIDASVKAHQRAMRCCKQLQNEGELEAELVYELTRNGCQALAYEPIVGAGENSCVLHYTDNNQPLKKGELVLIDAGGEYANYAADITRTFPINGHFNQEQRLIYELVLKAQKAAIALIKPGLPWNEIQQTIVRILTTGLCELGLLQGEVEMLIAKEAYKPFYMHSSGHWLGLDVHDLGSYKIKGEWRQLKPNMVLTIEPGIYIKAGLKGVDKRWWNIGVRIEDDILVTAEGHENLSAALPVEITELEALVRG